MELQRNIFENRIEAGRALGRALREQLGPLDDAVVLGLARGGVPVASEVAKALEVSLDVMVLRKLGVPGNRELAMGAIASGGVRVLNDRVIATLHLSDQDIDAATRKEEETLRQRERAYRADKEPVDIEGRTVILVDDGLATGATMRAAVMAARHANPRQIIVAVPVGAPESCARMRQHADEVVCALEPSTFFGVAQFYRDFTQVGDEQVNELLRGGRGRD